MKSIMKTLALCGFVASVAISAQSCCSSASSTSGESAIIEAIMTRSSVRSYTSQVVEEAKIETMLKAGMAAPTAGNKQPWEFVVITDRAILDALPEVAAGMKMAPKAPLAIAVCGVPSKSFPNVPEYWIQDCSAATENILLAAHGLGLGAVWCGAYPDGGSGRVEKMTELLQLPEEVIALSVIIIGYPDSEPTIKDKWDPAKVHYNKY